MPMRGLRLFKVQQKHMTHCVIHPDTTVMNREAILSIAAKFLFFFQQELLTGNTASSFSALIQHSQRQTQQSVLPRFHSRSSPSQQQKFLCFWWEEEGSHRIHSSASLLSTFPSQDIHSYSQHPISPHFYSQLKCMNRKISISAYPI